MDSRNRDGSGEHKQPRLPLRSLAGLWQVRFVNTKVARFTISLSVWGTMDIEFSGYSVAIENPMLQ